MVQMLFFNDARQPDFDSVFVAVYSNLGAALAAQKFYNDHQAKIGGHLNYFVFATHVEDSFVPPTF